MKRFLVVIILMCFFLDARSQNALNDTTKNVEKRHSAKKPFAYIGFSIGLNNPCGAGFDFDIPVKKYFTIGTGLGFSSWGNKLYIDAKYFLKTNHLGWALAGGIAYNSGVENFAAKYETVKKTTEEIKLNLHPLSTAFLGLFHYVKLGNRNSRLVIGIGYSVRLQQPQYEQVSKSAKLSDNAISKIQKREPGGFMLGLGFLFGLHH